MMTNQVFCESGLLLFEFIHHTGRSFSSLHSNCYVEIDIKQINKPGRLLFRRANKVDAISAARIGQRRGFRGVKNTSLLAAFSSFLYSLFQSLSNQRQDQNIFRFYSGSASSR